MNLFLENLVFLKCLQIDSLLVPYQARQTGRFKDELPYLPQRIHHTLTLWLQIFIDHKAHPRVGHGENGVTAFG